MAAPLIVFDIGSTLVTGPARGPAGRISRALGLADRQKAAVHHLLMTRRWDDPGAAGAAIRAEFGGPEQAIEDVVGRIWAEQEDAAAPLAGAADALRELARHGCRFAVASNIWLPYLTSARKHFGWFLDEWVPPAGRLYSFREGVAKPAPELLRKALAGGAALPHEAVMVGDSYANDIAPATALGMHTIWLLHRPEAELNHLTRVVNGAAPGPSLALRSIADLDWPSVSHVLAQHRA
jgi:FMN phosphatase YigB (HAD superfamily)